MKRPKIISLRTWKIIKDTAGSLGRNEPIVYSAAIAFFTIFSLPAILIVLTLVGSAFFSEERVRAEIVGQVESLISPEAAGQVDVVLENVVQIPAGIWGVIIGIAVVVKSATIIFFIMQKALNSVWKVTLKRKVNRFKVMKHRLITLGLVVGLGLLLVVSLLLDTALVMFSNRFHEWFGEALSPVILVANLVVYVGINLVFFTTIHKVLPDAQVEWKDALAVGIITSILFIIGKQVINLILSQIKVSGMYEAAGSLVILLLWVFYSSIILFLGAELTKSYANNHGREIRPTSIAVKYRRVLEEAA
ncbi:YihY/virulence factor BrkB family protein [soil metagenome]